LGPTGVKTPDWLLRKLLATELAYPSRRGAVQRALSGRDFVRARPVVPDSVVVAAIQMRADSLGDAAGIAVKYYDLVREAVERGAQLIVFPASSWLALLGLLPAMRVAAESSATLQGALESIARSWDLPPEGVLRSIVPAISRVFDTMGNELARRFGVYLMPGTVLAADQSDHLCETAYLFGPDGRVLGAQRRLHKRPGVAGDGAAVFGDDLRVAALPFGAVAIAVDIDNRFWETARVATMRGAEILLCPCADQNIQETNPSLRGVASRIQESYAYGVQASIVTRLFGMDLGGPSTIAAPLGLWDDETAVIAATKTHDQEEIVTAKLDLAHLRHWRSLHQRDLNMALYRKYLRTSYQAYRVKGLG
jgi:predicted amidohydrolase